MTPERAAAAEALTSQPPPGRPPARGRQEGKGDPFGTLLDQHQARTADAEGPEVKESRQDSTSTDRSQVAGRRSQGQAPATCHLPPATCFSRAQDRPIAPTASVRGCASLCVPRSASVEPGDGSRGLIAWLRASVYRHGHRYRNRRAQPGRARPARPGGGQRARAGRACSPGCPCPIARVTGTRQGRGQG